MDIRIPYDIWNIFKIIHRDIYYIFFRGDRNETATIIETFLEPFSMDPDLLGKYDKAYSHASFGVTRTLIYGVCAARKTGHNAPHPRSEGSVKRVRFNRP